MKKSIQKLTIQSIDHQLGALLESHAVYKMPKKGWINTFRTTLNISLRQLAMRLKITPQSVKEAELREMEGTITINNLKQFAKALDMDLFYILIPTTGSLESLIEERANKVARQIIYKTSHTMDLEDQSISSERLKKAIDEKAEELKREMPKYLWD